MARQLVDAAEGRLVVAGREARAHAPRIDARALALQAADRALVEVVGRDDPGRLEAGVVEDPARLDGEVREVAGIEADRRRGRGRARGVVARPRWRARTPVNVSYVSTRNTALLGMDLGVGIERHLLVTERHDPAMRVGPAHGDAVEPSGEDVRGRGARRRPTPPTRARARRRCPGRGAGRTRAPGRQPRHRRSAPPWSRRASGSR